MILPAEPLLWQAEQSAEKWGLKEKARLTGRGVSYCAVCDAAFFHDQKLAVVGGGDTAITEALHLTKFASKITIIHRRNQLRAAYILQEKVKSEPKIDFLWDTTISAIEGKDNGGKSQVTEY